MLLQGINLTKYYGGQSVLEDVSIQLDSGHKIGIVGENGTGKTTLIKLLGRMISPDSGDIAMKKGLRLGYVEQLEEIPSYLSVHEYVRMGDERIVSLERELQKFETGELTDHHQHDELLQEFDRLDGYKYDAFVSSVMQGLGIENYSNKSADELSGGERRRVLLARVLVSNPDVFLFDEPTNHLDIYAVDWLEGFLKQTRASFLLISHDKFLLNRTVDSIVEVNGKKLHSFSGNYEFYEQEKIQRQELRDKEYEKQQEMKKREEEFIRRNIAGQKTKQAQGRRKQLEKVDWLEKRLYDSKSYAFTFKETGRRSKEIMHIENLSVGYDTPVVTHISKLIRRGDKIAVTGRNGSGKSTFLKTLAGILKQHEGTLRIMDNIEIQYFDQNVELPVEKGTVYDQILALDPLMVKGDVLSYLARFYFREDDVDKKVNTLSGGERSRLKMAVLMMTAADCLILDEPTNHLDMRLRETVMRALTYFSGSVLMVSHDRYFLDSVVDEVIEFENGMFYHYDGNVSVALKEKDKRLAFTEEIMPQEKQQEQKSENPDKKTLSKNELRRAEIRLNEVESEIENLEEEKITLYSDLEDKSIYTDPDRLKQVNDRIQINETRMEQLMEEWEKLQEICSF